MCDANQGIAGCEVVDVYTHATFADLARGQRAERPRDRSRRLGTAAGIGDRRASRKHEDELRREERVRAAVSEMQHVLEVVAERHRIRVVPEPERQWPTGLRDDARLGGGLRAEGRIVQAGRGVENASAHDVAAELRAELREVADDGTDLRRTDVDRGERRVAGPFVGAPDSWGE